MTLALNGGILFYDESERTDVSTWALDQSGTGAVFDSPAAALVSGRPADQTAILWTHESGSVATTNFVSIQRVWTNARPIRGVEIRGVSLPAGTVVEVLGQRSSDSGTFPYSLGGNSSSAIVQFDDLSNGLIIVCDNGLDPIIGIELKIFNDCNGSTFLANDDFIYIGSFTCYQGWEPPQGVQFDWVPGIGGLPTDQQTANNQNRPIPNGQPYRTLSVTFEDQEYAGVYGDPADPTALTYNKIVKYMTSNYVGFVVRYLDDNGDIYPMAIQNLSIFGTCLPTAPKPTGNNYFQLVLAFTECAPNS